MASWFKQKEEEKIETALREERVHDHLSRERGKEGISSGPLGTSLDRKKKSKKKTSKSRGRYTRISVDVSECSLTLLAGK